MDSSFAFLSRIPDQTGYMVISDGAVIKSEGDLTNHDTLASSIMKILRIGAPLTSSIGESFESLTIAFSDYFFTISLSGPLTFIVKRKPAATPIETK
uniref:Late endosomal/lysosomal adaptor and MAPK and MTOR activator 4 n=1 Tax=Ascaris lumbricoides TaxID=6252 RepID=A0A0M3I1I5_ASCLU